MSTIVKYFYILNILIFDHGVDSGVTKISATDLKKKLQMGERSEVEIKIAVVTDRAKTMLA